jgi:hypothetical protein
VTPDEIESGMLLFGFIAGSIGVWMVAANIFDRRER